MKKKYYIFTGVALALAACANDDVVQSADNNQIKFDVVTNTTTSRALNMHNAGANLSKFNVWAYTNTYNVPYILNKEVSKDVNVWVMNPSYNWPANDALDFYAMHDETDYSAENKAEEAVLVQVSDSDQDNEYQGRENPFTTAMKVENIVMEDDEHQDDILYAVTPNKREADGSMVPINFRHALAAISFEVVNESPTLYVEANEITFCGAYDKGNLYFGTTTTKQYPNDYTTTTSEEETTTIADYPSTDCYWVIDKAATQKEYQLVEKTDDSTWSTILPYYKYVTESADLTTIDLSQTDADQILVIPQKHTAGKYDKDGITPWSGVYVKLHCRVYYIKEPHKFVRDVLDSDGNLRTDVDAHAVVTGNLSDGSDAASLVFGTTDGKEDFADLYVPLPTGQWQSGMKYIYRLTFGGDADTAKDKDGNSALFPMSVKAEVIAWPDAESNNQNIGYEEPKTE
jgi:hypothetical protein